MTPLILCASLRRPYMGMGRSRIMTAVGLSALVSAVWVVGEGFIRDSDATELAQSESVSLNSRTTSSRMTITQATIAQEADTQATDTQATGFPTLTLGSTGEAVRQLQATLTLMGFYQDTVDGSYSESTQTAVTSFQTAAGIAADGIAGPSTWRKLLPVPSDVTTTVAASPTPAQTATPAQAATPEQTATPAPAATPTPAAQQPAAPTGPPILRPGAEGSAVAQLQIELQTLGYYNGAIDGGYGEQTQAAVEEFQADKQLVVDAVVGPSTWNALSEALN